MLGESVVMFPQLYCIVFMSDRLCSYWKHPPIWMD